LGQTTWDNSRMQINFSSQNRTASSSRSLPTQWMLRAALCGLLSYGATASWAQSNLSQVFAREPNVLGLPPVPQPKPGSPAAIAAAAAASQAKAAGATATAAPPPSDRSAIAGELGIQHNVSGGVGRVTYTTKASFVTAGERSNAVEAGKAVQRDIEKACAGQCQPEKMAAPQVLPSGQLRFEVAIKPLYQHLSQAQMVAALQGFALNLTPEQLKPTAGAASTPAGSATGTASAAPTSGAGAAPVDRSLIAGEMGIQHSVINSVGRVIYTSKVSFASAADRSKAIEVGKAVQSDIGKACAGQCQPEKMAAPQITPNGQLQFEVAFKPLHQHLNQAQMLAALQGQALNLSPEQLKPPVATGTAASPASTTSATSAPSN
jgi:hypothetical protein